MQVDTDRVTALRAAGDAMTAARREAERLRDIARDAALESIAAGMSESSVARHVGIERATLRRWQGKSY